MFCEYTNILICLDTHYCMAKYTCYLFQYVLLCTGKVILVMFYFMHADARRSISTLVSRITLFLYIKNAGREISTISNGSTFSRTDQQYCMYD